MEVESESFKGLREQYRRPPLDSPLSEEILMILAVGVMHTPWWNELVSDREYTRIFHRCQRRAAEPVRSIVDRLIEVEVFNCRRPDPGADPVYRDPRRALCLLSKYWNIIRHIVVVESKAYWYHIPHPLLHLIVNLRKRVEGCVDLLTGTAGLDEVSGTVFFLLEALAAGDSADINAVPEYTERKLADVELLLEQAALTVGRRSYPLTRAERVFLGVARRSAQRYDEDTTARRKAAQKYLRSVAAERRRATADAEHRKETAPAASVNPTSLPPRKEEKVQKALKLIRTKGRVKGITLAGELKVEESTFRKHYVPILEQRGVRNDGDGYYLPAESPGA